MSVRPTFQVSRLLILLTILSCSSLATAASVAVIQPDARQSWFVGIGGGTSRINFSQNNTSVSNGIPAPAPYNQDSYSIDGFNSGEGQLAVGYRWVMDSSFLPYTHVYFQYRHYFYDQITGYVDQLSLAQFQNYQYQMNYEADMFTLNGKFDLMQAKFILPYINAGVGYVLNHVSNYSETALPNVTARISPNYAGNTTGQLALTLGVGLDFIVTENYWLTLGYDHVFQGNVKSGDGASTWSGTRLNFGNPRMDTVFINLSANFPQG